MSEELKGCALLLSCVLYAMDMVGRAPSFLGGGAGMRVCMGFRGAVHSMVNMARQQWMQGVHARLCVVCVKVCLTLLP